jgi:hypothetical protein
MSTPGFFTQGVTYELPHPPVDERTVLIVHAVIGHALDLLRTEPPPGFDLATAKEDVVTVHLQHVVENRLRKTGEVPGFDQRSFGRLWREPKVVSYDMRHLDKMPDMIFHLNRDSLAVLSTEDGLFVECKPADKAHPAGQDYCDAGVRRFVDGEYAWAMQDAMMVCYSRDGRTIPDHLVPASFAPRRPICAQRTCIEPCNHTRRGSTPQRAWTQLFVAGTVGSCLRDSHLSLMAFVFVKCRGS